MRLKIVIGGQGHVLSVIYYYISSVLSFIAVTILTHLSGPREGAMTGQNIDCIQL